MGWNVILREGENVGGISIDKNQTYSISAGVGTRRKLTDVPCRVQAPRQRTNIPEFSPALSNFAPTFQKRIPS
jgi:hypothetical protein